MNLAQTFGINPVHYFNITLLVNGDKVDSVVG